MQTSKLDRAGVFRFALNPADGGGSVSLTVASGDTVELGYESSGVYTKVGIYTASTSQSYPDAADFVVVRMLAGSVGASYVAVNDGGAQQGSDITAVNAALRKPIAGASSYYNQLATGAASTSAATTYENVRRLRRRPVAVRLLYKHNRTTAHTPLQFAVGSVASAASAAQNLLAVTFSGAAAVPATAVGVTTTVQQIYSDLIPVTPVERSDGQPGYLLAIRTLVPQDAGAAAFSYTNAALNGAPISSAGEMIFGTRQQSGDFVTTNQAGFTATTLANAIVLGDLIVYYDDIKPDLWLGIGDSIMTGEFSATGYDGWARQAVSTLVATGKNIDYLNQGWGGTTSATYLAAGLPMIARWRPKFASYAMHSPNDGAGSAALLAAQKARALDFIAACIDAGTLPVLVAPAPKNSRDSALQSHMLACRAWLLSYVGAVLGYPVVDLLSAMGDPADNTLFASGMVAADGVGGIHPNQAGYAAGAAAAVVAVSKYV